MKIKSAFTHWANLEATCDDIIKDNNANCFPKIKLIGCDCITVTFSDARHMKSLLMPSNAVLTEEVLRQLGDDGLSHLVVGHDGQVDSTQPVLPLVPFKTPILGK